MPPPGKVEAVAAVPPPALVTVEPSTVIVLAPASRGIAVSGIEYSSVAIPVPTTGVGPPAIIVHEGPAAFHWYSVAAVPVVGNEMAYRKPAAGGRAVGVNVAGAVTAALVTPLPM